MTEASDRFALRQRAQNLKDAMTDVLHNIPHTVAWSYAHKMVVSDVLVSMFTRQVVIRLSGCSIQTNELTEFLMNEMRARGVKEKFELEMTV